MNTHDLGKKIKEARIAKKMTQSEVVGDFMTRNMLSLIESGNAAPSVKTLEYLSSVLEIPFNQLMCGTVKEPLEQLSYAKQLLVEDNCEELLSMEDSFPTELFDEFSAIFSKAYLILAGKMFDDGQYGKASSFAQLSASYADKGIYANSFIRSEAIILMSKCGQKLTSDAHASAK